MKFAHYSEQLFTEHLDLFEIDSTFDISNKIRIKIILIFKI